MFAQKLAAGQGRAHRVQEGMTDKGGPVAVLRINCFFKGQNNSHAISQAANGMHPLFAPGPDLRAYVVEDGDAQFFGLAGQKEVEIRIVDQDQERWLAGAHARQQRLSRLQNIAQMA